MNVVITGATKGIGKAIAHKFLCEGHSIAICARDRNLLSTVHQEWKAKFPNSEIISAVADISKREDVLRFSQKILEEWDTIDILVNNAGTFIPGAIKDEDEKTLPFLMETNMYSAYYLTKDLLPKMIKAQSGHIFNMCSVASFMAYPNGGSYAISKFALLGFTKCLREELKPHQIKVTAVMPGATYTDSWQSADIQEERFIPAEDIALLIYQTSQLSPSSVVEDIIIRPQLGDL